MANVSENQKERRFLADVVRVKREGDKVPLRRPVPPLQVDPLASIVTGKREFVSGGSAHGLRHEIPLRRGKLIRNAILGVLLLGVIAGSLAVFDGYQKLRGAARFSVEQFQGALADLRLFRPDAAEQKFSAVQGSLHDPFGELATKLFPMLKKSSDAFKNIQGLTGSAIALTQEISRVDEAFQYFAFDGKGEEFLAYLRNLDGLMKKIIEEGKMLQATAEGFRTGTPSEFIPFQIDLTRFEGFTAALTAWLEGSEDEHLLVLLQNPSEMRPSGGFLGSYADVVIRNGAVHAVNVYDINDVDRELDLLVIPPKPLQLITKEWRSADANWFFDFSDSARTVIELMEASNYYKKDGVTFDGAVAVSPDVLRDLLFLTGPVEIEGYRAPFTSENFLIEIQTYVQLGQEKRASYPKKVLQELAPILLERLRAVSSESEDRLFDILLTWFANRDLMVYFKDPELQQFFDYYEVTGEPYPLSEHFQGDYLAVVAANVGGGKTDLFVDQHVRLESRIGDEGIVSNTLTVTRDHHGSDGEYWWYKLLNQSYVRVFVPPGSRLTGFEGGSLKEISPPVNYAKEGYIAHPLVLKIEKTVSVPFGLTAVESFEESGRTVFGAWMRVPVDERKAAVFEYSRRLPFPPADGQTYQFVVDKQAGTHHTYEFEMTAPAGFRWRENNLPVYEYFTETLPGRLGIVLTLERV